MNSVRSLFFRLLCKGFEYLCRFFTLIRNPARRDPSWILIEHRTQVQRAAAERPATSAPALRGDLLIMIPFRDRWHLTHKCLESLRTQRVDSGRVHILLLDNGSQEEDTLQGMAAALACPMPDGFTLEALRLDEPFNFSRLNNKGLTHCRWKDPEWVLFLNNDVELGSEHDLRRLWSFAETRPDLGALGCSLTYPDGRLQHVMVAPGVKIVASHPLKGLRLEACKRWMAGPQPVAAVTGAAMWVSRHKFEQVGGFDEHLPTVGQDVDLCLKLQKAGYVNWALPDVILIHGEGASRGGHIDKNQVGYIYDKWGSYLTDNPSYPHELTRWSEQPAYRLGEGSYPWHLVLP